MRVDTEDAQGKIIGEGFVCTTHLFQIIYADMQQNTASHQCSGTSPLPFERDKGTNTNLAELLCVCDYLGDSKGPEAACALGLLKELLKILD